MPLNTDCNASRHLHETLIDLDHASAALSDPDLPTILRRPGGPIGELKNRVQRVFAEVEAIQRSLLEEIGEAERPYPVCQPDVSPTSAPVDALAGRA